MKYLGNAWFVMNIEPNYADATAIAHHWLQLFRATSRI